MTRVVLTAGVALGLHKRMSLQRILILILFSNPHLTIRRMLDRVTLLTEERELPVQPVAQKLVHAI